MVRWKRYISLPNLQKRRLSFFLSHPNISHFQSPQQTHSFTSKTLSVFSPWSFLVLILPLFYHQSPLTHISPILLTIAFNHHRKHIIYANTVTLILFCEVMKSSALTLYQLLQFGALTWIVVPSTFIKATMVV